MASAKKEDVKMETKLNEIEVNGVRYVPKDQVRPAVMADYCIVRTRSAGVFAGTLAERDGMEGRVENARRLWYWKGAASLSQMAVSGVSCPGECKFAVPVPSVTLTEIIEVLPCTKEAFDSISGVPAWTA